MDWRPEKQGDVRKRHEKVVIIRNMFHPTDFEVWRDTHMHIHALSQTHTDCALRILISVVSALAFIGRPTGVE